MEAMQANSQFRTNWRVSFIGESHLNKENHDNYGNIVIMFDFAI